MKLQKEELLKKFTREAKESDIQKISQKLGKMYKGAIKEVWPKVQALYKMIKDPQAAWKSKALAIGTLLYLISPLDAIPDVIPAAGLTDDAALIMGTVAMLGHELKKYLVKSAEEFADIEIRKHNRKVRITLISLIICAVIGIAVKLVLERLG